MKKTIFLFSMMVFAIIAFSQTNPSSIYQPSYYKPTTNTYVQPHFKTTKNNTNHDNYSTKDNINPYTGVSGTKAKDYSSNANNYGGGKSIYTGPNGGQYYYNDKNNKVYVPKR